MEHSRTAESDLRGSWLLIATEWDQAYADGTASTGSIEALTEYLGNPDTHSVFAQFLARLARILAPAGELDLLTQVIEDTPKGMVLYDNNILSARAVLAETRGEHADALGLHDAAAAAWASYGYPLEQAHALIGAAQCRAALGEPAKAQLVEARDILARIDARPLLAETERMLAATPA